MEIKFRGKRVDNGEWVYGFLVRQYHSRKLGKRIDAIFYSDELKTYRIPIISDTVGQFIGRKDKNSTEMYGGDIIRFVIPEDKPESKREKRIIFWSKDLCGFHAKTLDSKYHCFINGELFEIIGNIHENPELLEVKKDINEKPVIPGDEDIIWR